MAHVDAWALDQITQELTGSELALPRCPWPNKKPPTQPTPTTGRRVRPSPRPNFPASLRGRCRSSRPRRGRRTPAPSTPPLEFSPAGPILETAPTAPDLPIGPDLIATNINALGLIGSPLALERDAYGNAIGGLRLPVMPVPVATYNGDDGVLVGTSTSIFPGHPRRPLSDPRRLRRRHVCRYQGRHLGAVPRPRRRLVGHDGLFVGHPQLGHHPNSRTTRSLPQPRSRPRRRLNRLSGVLWRAQLSDGSPRTTDTPRRLCMAL